MKKCLALLLLSMILVSLSGTAFAIGRAIVDVRYEDLTAQPDGKLKLSISHNDDEMTVWMSVCDEDGYIYTDKKSSASVINTDGYYGSARYRLIVSHLENGMYFVESIQCGGETVWYSVYSLDGTFLNRELFMAHDSLIGKEAWCDELNKAFEPYGISFTYTFVNSDEEHMYPAANRPESSAVVLYVENDITLPSLESEKDAAMARFTPDAPAAGYEQEYLPLFEAAGWKLGSVQENTGYSEYGTLMQYTFIHDNGCKIYFYIDPAAGTPARISYSETPLYKGQHGYNAQKLLEMAPSEELLAVQALLSDVLAVHQPEAAQAMASLPLTGTDAPDMGGGPTLTTRAEGDGMQITYTLQYQTAGDEQLARGFTIRKN